MRKKLSLREKADLAERREADAKRRMREMDLRVRRANAISDGSMIMTTMLAAQIGSRFVITKEQQEAAKNLEYVVKVHEDGALEYCLAELVDNPDTI